MEYRNEKSTVSKLDELFKKSYQNLKVRSESRQSKSYLTTGFNNLDDIIGGWDPGELIIFGARPGMGKSAILISMMREITRKSSYHVGLISLESSNDFLLEKIISIESGVPITSIRKAKLSEKEWEKIDNAKNSVAKYEIYIVQDPGDGIDDLTNYIRELVTQYNVKVVMLDYLQLVEGIKGRHNREQEISSTIRILKKLARELDIAIIVASQLNRSVELRSGNKKPILADLRDSGAIEEDADKVLFIHRPEVYGLDVDEEGNSLKGLAEIIIAKNRSGPCGWTMLNFDREFGKFYEIRTDPEAFGDIPLSDLPEDIPPF